MSAIRARFTKERETKNTVRFAEVGDEANHKIGTLYVKKTALNKVGGDLPELEVWFGPPEPEDDDA